MFVSKKYSTLIHLLSGKFASPNPNPALKPFHLLSIGLLTQGTFAELLQPISEQLI